ncbi:hypothetical protein FOMPIDRAFT_1054383 [Fomitopsis schrenkii]|uniref:Uncharacterized protein n=1 Tax=Fomitopsis schrenkii TaxID=2126942 RepID=S8F990_FOMSC|nr:hypothetical protein FOMPIDRAFT_1054383 [Fomitopsis schrenkii]
MAGLELDCALVSLEVAQGPRREILCDAFDIGCTLVSLDVAQGRKEISHPQLEASSLPHVDDRDPAAQRQDMKLRRGMVEQANGRWGSELSGLITRDTRFWRRAYALRYSLNSKTTRDVNVNIEEGVGS